MDSVVLDQAAAVPLPLSPSTNTQDFPNLLAQAAVVTNGPETPRSLADSVDKRASQLNEHLDTSLSGEAERTGTEDAKTSVNGDRPTPLARDDNATPPKPVKDLSSPTPEDEPTSSGPPTPTFKPIAHRTDSGRSITTQSSVTSPRGIPAPLPLHATVERQSNGRISMSSPSPSLVPPTPPGHRRSLTISKGNTVSAVLISTALETIASSREAKRSPPLKDAVQRALEMVRAGEGGDRPREIFEPLRLACETRNEKLMIASLDCISKLISYSFFVESPSQERSQFTSPPTPRATSPPLGSASQESIADLSLVDIVVHTITSCHSETTADSVSLQIVKALLSLVLSPIILVHHSSLLKVIRTVYNVFLLSMDPVTQTVAQGGLTQMVHHVFTRCRVSDDGSFSDASGGESTPPSKTTSPSISTTDSLPTHTMTPPSLQRPLPTSQKPSPHKGFHHGSTDSVPQSDDSQPHDHDEAPVNGDAHPPRMNEGDEYVSYSYP